MNPRTDLILNHQKTGRWDGFKTHKLTILPNTYNGGDKIAKCTQCPFEAVVGYFGQVFGECIVVFERADCPDRQFMSWLEHKGYKGCLAIWTLLKGNDQ